MGEHGLEVLEPDAGERSAAAGVLARAFLDDPVWRGVGPRPRWWRRVTNRVSFAGTLAASHRNGARIRVARRGDVVVGATIAFEPGRWPLPDRAALWELPWALLAGPPTVFRGIETERVQRDHQSAEPQLYLWYIGVEPSAQGTGVGAALLAELHRRGDELGLPAHLETGTEPNIGFYRRHGYRSLERYELPRAGTWLERMVRDPAPESEPLSASSRSRPEDGA